MKPTNLPHEGAVFTAHQGPGHAVVDGGEQTTVVCRNNFPFQFEVLTIWSWLIVSLQSFVTALPIMTEGLFWLRSPNVCWVWWALTHLEYDRVPCPDPNTGNGFISVTDVQGLGREPREYLKILSPRLFHPQRLQGMGDELLEGVLQPGVNILHWNWMIMNKKKQASWEEHSWIKSN